MSARVVNLLDGSERTLPLNRLMKLNLNHLSQIKLYDQFIVSYYKIKTCGKLQSSTILCTKQGEVQNRTHRNVAIVHQVT